MRRLLLIEDEEGIRLAVGEFLRYRGYVVDCAQGREQAEALLAKGPYACVIADLCLGNDGANVGLLLVAAVRRLWPAMPVIVLTGMGEARIEETATRLGVAAFLLKPTPLAHLAGVIEDLLERAFVSDGSGRKPHAFD
jgi:DNA-binding NtrC family response regulator